VLTVMDGIIAGEGDGPLAPRDVPLGTILAATDPIALDLVALRLMGFDEQNVPKIREPMADQRLRITNVHNPQDVVVFEVDARSFDLQQRPLNEIRCDHVFLAHPGWIGHIERKPA
jgi:uncharacterized protein (DUF362 family)